jgi:polygalacturonase
MNILITDYGARGDGETLNTDAIQRAIDACFEGGGGEVLLPPGRFLSGTLQLRSRVGLHLEAGAVLVGSPRLEDYRHSGFVHVDNHFSHAEGGLSLSLTYADGEEDVGIRGRGTIDFSSDAFFDFDAVKPIKGVDETRLSAEQRAEAAVPKKTGPTQPVFFTGCKRVEVSGVKLVNAPSLTINLNDCSDVRIHRITIEDDLRVPISDGIHICACQDVIITDSVFVCGDDCVALTGVTNWNGVSERILISNCSMRSSSAAVRVGYLAGKIRDVVISNLVIQGTTRGFTVFAGDDGWVENVSIENIVMRTRIRAGDWWGKGEPLVIFAPKSNGRIENIRVRGITAQSENGIAIIGDRKNIREVSLEDWLLELKRGPNHELLGGLLDLEPVETRSFPSDTAPWLQLEEAAGIRLSNIRYRAPVSDKGPLPAEPFIRDSEIVLERDVMEIS